MESFGESFPYRSLVTGSSLMRVVSVEPGSIDEPVQCKLQYVNLDERPEYEALSYVWGDPNVTVPITLDGIRFPVTTNLHLALRYLRREDTRRTLWVDAICINQTDIAERNEQVMRMRDIYKYATKVVIWVGEDCTNPPFGGSMAAEQIFTQLDRVARRERDDAEEEAVDPGGWAFRVARRERDDAEEEAVDPVEWTFSILGFVCLPWFKRIWIIQESAVNLKAHIACGRASLPWLVFLHGLMRSLPAMRLTWMAIDWLEYFLSNVVTLQTCLHLYHNWKDEILAANQIAARIARLLFELGGNFQCTDPRDRLFAILGLVPGAFDALAATGLSVEYRRSAADIFRDLAVFLITQRRSLDILAAYGVDWIESTTGSFTGKPSWVPTWDKHPHCTLTPILLSRMDEDAYGDAPLAEFRFSEDKRTLFIRGVVLGEIALLGDEITWESLHGSQDPAPEGSRFLAGLFRRWEHKILGSPLLEQRYRAPDEALAAWKHCLFHPEDDLRVTQHFCYDVLLGHVNMSDIAEGQRDAVRSEIDAFTRFTPWSLENKHPFVVSSGDIGIAERVVAERTLSG
ncbi:hypothetical protein DL769_005156 [Monosporascus sp. CRB-8-3]|nr:hypothetical protein DL769_005156 [Monosporascus sp. CRB-8-3]